LLKVLPADPCLFIARVCHFSALNDRLEAAIDHAFAVEWHGIRLLTNYCYDEKNFKVPIMEAIERIVGK
jgi:hypothetical protein